MFQRNTGAAGDMLRTDFDPFDPWGWCLGHHFAIAELLHLEGEDVPDAWEFRASPMMGRGEGVADYPGKVWHGEDDNDAVYPDCEWSALWLAGHVDADELRRIGTILGRYAQLLDHAGRSY